ncbi:MAG: helicase-related protein [Solirubrobacterales bacterium]
MSEWSSQSASPFRFITVCRDPTVTSRQDATGDEPIVNALECGIPTTTDPAVVRRFLVEGERADRIVVFSTYQSLPQVVDALDGLPEFSFDLSFFDEAHRTAGASFDTGFKIGLDGDRLPSVKRLFMTATERLFRPRAIEKAEKKGVQLFSMDQEDVYGPVLYSLSFREAIDQKIIAPYEVVVAAIRSDEVDVQAIVDAGHWLRDDDDPTPLEANSVLAALAIGRAIEQLQVRKVVSFHGTVRAARELTSPALLKLNSDRLGEHAYHVNGAMTGPARAQVLADFAGADTALLSNARCLVEGVDIPLIDSVCFATTKTSLIDIVQAVGRALRKPWGLDDGKVAKIIVPVLVDGSEGFDATQGEFASVFNVIQALRDQDSALADVIDAMNLRVAEGRWKSRGQNGLGSVMTVVPIGSVDLEALRDSLELRVSYVNARPGEELEFVPLGVGERGSKIPRTLRALADYTPGYLENSLIQPTIDRISELDEPFMASQIRLNNNNISHCVRLGVIEAESGKKYRLTRLGRRFLEGSIEFDDLLRNQMLIYKDPDHQIFSYRLLAELVLARGSIRYWDFLFGIANADPQATEDGRLLTALKRIELAAPLYPNLLATSKTNLPKVSERLGELLGIELGETDIWTDRTTAGNTFRYFCRQVELFERVFVVDEPEVAGSHVSWPTWARRRLALGPDSEAARSELRSLLSASGSVIDQRYGEAWWLSDS